MLPPPFLMGKIIHHARHKQIICGNLTREEEREREREREKRKRDQFVNHPKIWEFIYT
jgi:hypothetical protein